MIVLANAMVNVVAMKMGMRNQSVFCSHAVAAHSQDQSSHYYSKAS
jgi:hypothetical protein